MFFKDCQIVVVWRASQWNLCKISLSRKWSLSPERAKGVFSNFNKRTLYLGKLTTACFITHLRLSMSQKWRKSNFELVPTVGRYLRKAALKKSCNRPHLGCPPSLDVSAQGLTGEDNVACSLRGKQVNLKMIAKEFIYSVKIKKHLL